MSFLVTEDHRARSLETVPVCVRRKLAECGLELGAEQWAGLPIAARRRMFDMRVESARERRSFANLVRWLCGTFLEAPPAQQEGVPAPWRASEPPRDSELSPSEWRALSIDGRFAVVEAPTREARHRLLSALTDPPPNQ
ncbi:MAG: hypothetical protein JJ863_28925 [Deltaproteobacteria bacterium]|nr:hypothetical protein [Deltaproteobacteria bacterium]